MKRKRPEQSLATLLAQRPDQTDTSRKGIDKRVTTLNIASAEEKEADTGGLISPSLFVPSDEQLSKINKFTLRKVAADDVACFTTHSCNDLIDRDDDRFVTSAVKGFAKLEYPYSPTGKSYMVGHDYTKLAVGRIFDTNTKTVSSGGTPTITFLTNDVYIPRTAANQAFIENLEFGVNWAVSVGVVLGKSECEVGKPHDWGYWSFCCSKGHEKGLYYDPDSDEEDDWGYPLPVSETDSKAVRCVRDLDEAKDMYELSQVFLGAQYFAEVSKRAGLEAVIKSAHSFPVIGLKRSEADSVPTPAIPEKLREASRKHKVSENDGSFTWTDEEHLVWSFTPGEDTDPMCLGRAAENADKLSEIRAKRQDIGSKLAEARDAIAKDAAGAGAIAAQLDGLINELDDALDSDNDDAADTLIDQVQDLMDQLFDELAENENADETDANLNPLADENENDDYNQGKGAKHPKEDFMSKKAVLAAVSKVSFPRSVIEEIEKAPEEGVAAFESFISETSKMLTEMTPKAAAGEAWMKELRADVIDMYVKSKTGVGEGTKGVDIKGIEKLLDRVGNDPEVLKTLRDEYRSAFQAKFPQPVRRSTVELDVNDPSHLSPDAHNPELDIEKRIDRKSVKKIHG